MGELVDDVQHSELPPFMGPVLDEVVGPNMVGPLGAQANARSVGKPETASFGLSGRDFQPLAPPDAFDPLVVDHPARLAAKKCGDPAVAIAAVATGKLDDVFGQLPFVVPASGPAPLRRAMLAQRLADPPLRNSLGKNGAEMVDAGTPTRRAQKFPRDASDRISLSSVRSATALRNRSFSFCSSFI